MPVRPYISPYADDSSGIDIEFVSICFPVVESECMKSNSMPSLYKKKLALVVLSALVTFIIYVASGTTFSEQLQPSFTGIRSHRAANWIVVNQSRFYCNDPQTIERGDEGELCASFCEFCMQWFLHSIYFQV